MDTLKKAPGETITYTFTGDAEALGLTEDGVICQEPLDIRFDAVYQDGKIKLNGTFRTEVTMFCSRCTEIFTTPLEGYLEEEFPVDDQSEIDVAELIKEMFIISLPLKPLCHEACKGLCPTCGKNRNEKECACSEDEIDPRLADLKKLLEE